MCLWPESAECEVLLQRRRRRTMKTMMSIKTKMKKKMINTAEIIKIEMNITVCEKVVVVKEKGREIKMMHAAR